MIIVNALCHVFFCSFQFCSFQNKGIYCSLLCWYQHHSSLARIEWQKQDTLEKTIEICTMLDHRWMQSFRSQNYCCSRKVYMRNSFQGTRQKYTVGWNTCHSPVWRWLSTTTSISRWCHYLVWEKKSPKEESDKIQIYHAILQQSKSHSYRQWHFNQWIDRKSVWIESKSQTMWSRWE